MIISRTPFRISFFGGGTDYPKWFRSHEGAVLGTTINKYCYITCRYLPPFFDHKHRIIYSKMEHVKKISDIQHPAVREVLRYLKVRSGIEIHHDGDLPARTGLGSSSAFTVGLLNSLYALKGKMSSNELLAREAILIEQKKCKENVGCQDQILAAYGGLNLVRFSGTEDFQVKKVITSKPVLKQLQNHMMLFFTGFSRTASTIAKHQLDNVPKRQAELKAMYEMVDQAVNYLYAADFKSFGKLLYESWELKKSLSKKISTDTIDSIIDKARSVGAYGGKVLGAGGGGFVLIFASPEYQTAIVEKLKNFLLVPVQLENLGSQIVFYQPNGEAH